MSPGHLADLAARGLVRVEGERVLFARVAARELPAVGAPAEATALARLALGPAKGVAGLDEHERRAAVALFEWAASDGAAEALAPAPVAALRGLLSSAVDPQDYGAWSTALGLARAVFEGVAARGREGVAS